MAQMGDWCWAMKHTKCKSPICRCSCHAVVRAEREGEMNDKPAGPD